MEKTLPKGWEKKKLGELLKRKTSQILPTDYPDTQFTYIGLENIESNTGLLFNTNIEYGRNIKSTKSKFEKGDILYGKLRPYLNKVWLADRSGICSTDIWVFQPIESLANGYYISTFLRSKQIVSVLNSNTEGVNLPRVQASDFNRLPIPLPPLPTQHKIVEILEKADSLRKLRQKADEKMKDLIPSLFVQMFGDPTRNSKGWEVKQLREICETVTGGTPSKDKKEYFENGNIPWLRSGDISKGLIHKAECFITELGLQNSSAKLLPLNSVLVAMYGATAGQVGLLKFESAINQAICGMLPNKQFIPEFLYWSLASKAKDLKILRLGGAQPNLSQTIIRKLKIPLPPLPLQQEFAVRVEEIEAEKQRQAEGRKKLDELFNSLMQRAFKGGVGSIKSLEFI